LKVSLWCNQAGCGIEKKRGQISKGRGGGRGERVAGNGGFGARKGWKEGRQGGGGFRGWKPNGKLLANVKPRSTVGGVEELRGAENGKRNCGETGKSIERPLSGPVRKEGGGEGGV